MRVFVTGASGFIGSAVVPELIAAGHQVMGLARSDASAQALTAIGAGAHRGSLEDLESLRSGADAADGVIHLAFIHDFSNYAAASAADARAIETLGAALGRSGRPLVVASGTLGGAPGRVLTEDDAPDPRMLAAMPRLAGSLAALSLATRGVRSSIVRLAPSVHDDGTNAGLVEMLIATAREKRVAAYVGDGANRWPAVHVLDAAQLFRLALEQAPAGALLNAVAEEGVTIRAITELIARRLDVPLVSITPAEAPAHFGFVGAILAADSPASNVLTRERLGWKPTHPGLLDDLERGHFFETSPV